MLLMLGLLLLSHASLPSTCATTSLTGVLYSDLGGPSGAGMGEIRLAVAGRIYRLAYQKPYKQRFSSPSCSDIGAIWSVTVVLRSDSEGTLYSATCNGSLDTRTHEPFLIVRAYLQHILAGSIDSARTLLSARLRESRSFSTLLTELQALDYTGYDRFGGRAGCLEVAKIPTSNQTSIRAGPGCFLKHEGEPIDIIFNAVLIHPPKRWEIDDIVIRKPQ